jgi:hypothetical protein
MKGSLRFPVVLPIFGILILAVIGFRYQEYVLYRHFPMTVYAPCNALEEKCFVSSCSPEEDIGCPIGPYKKIFIQNSDAPHCLENHSCDSFSCDGIASCETTYCGDDSVEDGESCSNLPPAQITGTTTKGTL